MSKISFVKNRSFYLPAAIVVIYAAGLFTQPIRYRSKYSADERREIDKATDQQKFRIDIARDEEKLRIKRDRLEKSLAEIKIDE